MDKMCGVNAGNEDHSILIRKTRGSRVVTPIVRPERDGSIILSRSFLGEII
jgi:hypothetical protein